METQVPRVKSYANTYIYSVLFCRFSECVHERSEWESEHIVNTVGRKFGLHRFRGKKEKRRTHSEGKEERKSCGKESV